MRAKNSGIALSVPLSRTHSPPSSLKKKPNKQVLQSGGDAPRAAKPAADGKAAAAKPAAKKEQRVAETSAGGINPQAVALPGALALIGAGTFAISKLDDGFFDFLEATSAKNSGLDGAGYETAIKAEGFATGGKKGGSKKGGGLFGKK